MGYETLETIMNSSMIIGTAVGVASAAVAYTVGRLTRSSKYKLEREKTTQAQIQLERDREFNKVELERLRYDNADLDQKRQIDLIELRRKHGLEDQGRERQEYLDDKVSKKQKRLEEMELENQGKEAKRQSKLQLADKLVELKPVLQTYLDSLKPSGVQEDLDYLNHRGEYRAQLIEKALQEIEENGNGIMPTIIQEERDPINDEAQTRINLLVDLKYPLGDTEVKTPKMPKELRRLIKAVL